MIRKAWSIIRAHGLTAACKRASAWLRNRFERSSIERRRRRGALAIASNPRLRPIALRTSEQPLVSIIIPVYNQRPLTNACLFTLAEHWDDTIPAEVLVVDDASNDDTPAFLSKCRGIRVIRCDANRGFIQACNTGHAQARGEYVCFLNNDALVTTGWLHELLATLDDDTVGAVSPQLRYPDGRIAEAGGIIWRDGRGSHYGDGERRSDSRFTHKREIDYGSGACLLTTTSLFSEVGGFSPAYAPAYYEDVDLCFALRERGYRIVYQPRAIVVHIGGASYNSTTQNSSRTLQKRNREQFVRRWNGALDTHFSPDPALSDAAARRLCGSPRVLVVDDCVPFADRSAGSQRIFACLKLLKHLGCDVLFGSLDPQLYPRYSEDLEAMGIEVLRGFNATSIAQLVQRRLPIDTVWISRLETAATFLPLFRRSFPTARLAFDTVDLHYLRMQREHETTGRANNWEAVRDREIQCARCADLTIVASEVERDILHAAGTPDIAVVPVIEPLVRRGDVPWEQRSGIVFLGNYTHAPNVDAARWLCTEIMPLVWQQAPRMHLTLAGADPTIAVQKLAGDRVTVTGYIESLDEIFDTHRMLVAPIRYGAGIKGKITRALANGIPVVTTSVGAEGIFTGDDCGIIAETSEMLARAILDLDTDRVLWERLANGASLAAQRFTPEAVAPEIERTLLRHTAIDLCKEIPQRA